MGGEPRSRQLLLVKVETTYGTDSVPTAAANALQAVDPVVTPQADLLERRPADATMGLNPAAVGARWVEVTFGVEVRGSGTLDVAPKGLGDALQACGFTEAVNVAVDVTYLPESDPALLKSVTIYAYLAGREHKITGCIGNVELVAAAGQHAQFNFTFQGIYIAPTAVAQPTPTFDTTIPPVVLSAAFDYKAITTLIVQQLQINMQNEIARRDDVSASSGIKGFQLVDRAVIGSFNPEQEPLATHDPFADWVAGTTAALSMVIGSAAGNIWTITGPKLTYRTVPTADRNGILIYDHEVQFGKDAGDDEVKLVHT